MALDSPELSDPETSVVDLLYTDGLTRQVSDRQLFIHPRPLGTPKGRVDSGPGDSGREDDYQNRRG